jgi:hypothetical protein
MRGDGDGVGGVDIGMICRYFPTPILRTQMVGHSTLHLSLMIHPSLSLASRWLCLYSYISSDLTCSQPSEYS